MRNLEETKKNIIDTTNHIEPEKIPVGIDIFGWAFGYAGVNYDELVDDPAACADAYCKIFEEHPLFDFTASNCVAASPYKALNVLGVDKFVLSGDRTTVIHNQANQKYMGVEIYDEIIADADKFVNETFPHFMLGDYMNKPYDEVVRLFKEACLQTKPIMETNFIIGDRLTNGQQIYGLYDESLLGFYAPFDRIFDSYRGIKDSLVDLRRMPDKVYEACEALWVQMMPTFAYEIDDVRNPLPMANTIYHSECFLSPKQYDKVFFQYLMRGFGASMEAGNKMFLLGEGSFINTIDRFRDTPKHAMVIQLDQDDPIEAKKIVGDWCTLCGGITLDMLMNGTKEQCIDMVKKSFDELAPGGGFMFAPDKEIVSGKDAKAENLIAAFEEADRLSRQ